MSDDPPLAISIRPEPELRADLTADTSLIHNHWNPDIY
jgi:hypothetical protein